MIMSAERGAVVAATDIVIPAAEILINPSRFPNQIAIVCLVGWFERLEHIK